MSRTDRIRKILHLLNKAYGPARPFRKSKALDELIRTVLSQNTSDRNSLAAFDTLKKNFKSWEELPKTGTAKIGRLIRHAGLANIKAKRIKDILIEIKRREGKLSLAHLKNKSIQEASSYLRSLKGVGPKTAACVLLFSFAKAVMPVDTHIYRITKRLGLIGRHLGIEEAHEALTNIVPKGLIYRFHLGIIEHGRKTCKAQNPLCGVCLLYNLCRFKDKGLYSKSML